MTILLIPSFEVPDAFGELATAIPHSRQIEWPSAASVSLGHQEEMAGPLLQQLYAAQRPSAVVVLGNAASAALAEASVVPDAQFLLVDPTPHLPQAAAGSMEGLDSALAAAPGTHPMLDDIDAAEHEADRAQVYLDWLEHEVINAVPDPYERRAMASSLHVMRRDGLSAAHAEPSSRPVPNWYESLSDPATGGRTTVWLTSRPGIPRPHPEPVLDRGAGHVEVTDLPLAWWWADLERAARLVTRLSAG